MMNYPVIVFAVSMIGLWISVNIGYYLRKRSKMDEPVLEQLELLLGAGLTLLGPTVGFSFSIAVSQYDQRKNYEEAEANAVGTEFVRAGLLPTDSASCEYTLWDYPLARPFVAEYHPMRSSRTESVRRLMWPGLKHGTTLAREGRCAQSSPRRPLSLRE